MMFLGAKPVRILFIEDEYSNSEKVVSIFKEISYYAKVQTLAQGDLVTQYLSNILDSSDADMPDLVLLDLNFPSIAAFNTLKDLKSAGEFRKIPVVVISNKKSEELVKRSYELAANSFIVKPDDVEEYKAMLKAVEQFWLKTVSLPNL